VIVRNTGTWKFQGISQLPEKVKELAPKVRELLGKKSCSEKPFFDTVMFESTTVFVCQIALHYSTDLVLYFIIMLFYYVHYLGNIATLISVS